MTLCEKCWRKTGGHSVHRVTPERSPDECTRCGHRLTAVAETRVEVDDSNPLE